MTVPERAWRSPGSWVRFLVPAVVGLAADLWLKSWAFPGGVPADEALRRIAGRNPAVTMEPQAWIPNILGFTTTINEGAVFGIGQGHVLVFLGFSIIALAVILWVFLTSFRRQWVVHIALGLITAGAIGNLYDRAMFGGVRDMLRLLCMHFAPIHLFGRQIPSGALLADGTVDWYPYIFNIADVCLCVGVPVLILRWLFVKDPGPREEKVPSGPTVSPANP